MVVQLFICKPWWCRHGLPPGLLGAWCCSFEKSAEKPVEIPLRDQNNRIVTRIVLKAALAHRIVVGLW